MIGKRSLRQRYRDALANLNGLTLPTADDGHSWNQFVVRIGSCPAASRCATPAAPSTTSARQGFRKLLP